MENEIWKDVVGYENLYQVSNLGNVKRTALLKPHLDHCGYCFVNLSKNGVVKCLRVHTLVANAFIPNELNKKEINHINGIKTDNRVDNLEWTTHKENMEHAIKTGLMNKESLKRIAINMSLLTRKKVGQYKNGTLIKEYISCACATRETGIHHISCCANGKRKQAGGFEWKYI